MLPPSGCVPAKIRSEPSPCGTLPSQRSFNAGSRQCETTAHGIKSSPFCADPDRNTSVQKNAAMALGLLRPVERAMRPAVLVLAEPNRRDAIAVHGPARKGSDDALTVPGCTDGTFRRYRGHALLEGTLRSLVGNLRDRRKGHRPRSAPAGKTFSNNWSSTG